MITDFVLGKDNEKSFIPVAEKLGFQKLVFIYMYEKRLNASALEKKLSEFKKKTKLQLDVGFLIDNAKNIQKAKQSGKPILFSASPESDIRTVAQKHKPTLITNLEFQKHDFVHHRSSGMNQVIATAMYENTISYAPAFPLLFSTKYKGEVLGRMMQNIRLSKKYGVTMQYCSLARHPYEMHGHIDILSLLRTLQTDEKVAKETLEL